MPLTLIYSLPTSEIIVRIPIIGSNINIDWGGTGDSIGLYIFKYTTPGTKTIMVTGNVTNLNYTDLDISTQYLISCTDFNDVGLERISFFGATNLINVPNELPPSIIDISFMFCDATLFNQDVSSWDVSKIIDMEYAFKNTNLSIENYNKILNTWSNLDLEPCNFKNNVLVYTEEGSIGRQNLITKGWNIQDDILLTPSTIYVNEPFLLKYNHGIWNSLLWGGSIVMSYKMTILEQIPINSTTRDLIFNPIRISDTGKIQLLVKVIKNNQVVATEYIHLYVNAHNIPVTVNKPRMSMGSLFTDNSMVYYKPHSLAAGGIGGVRNYRKKSKKT